MSFDTRNIIVNLHLFKTGGSTLRDTLTRNYGSRHLYVLRDRYWTSSDLTEMLDRHKDAVAITRHDIRFGGTYDTDKYRFFPVFFLREPLAWFASIYYFRTYKPIIKEAKISDACAIIARTSKDISEFARVFAREKRDIMSEYIRDTIMTHKDGTIIGIDEFESDIQRYHIGITDRYDESCVVLEEDLQRHFPGIDLAYDSRKNSNTAKEYMDAKSKMSDLKTIENGELADMLSEMNNDVKKLYSIVSRELDMRISNITDFDVKLQRFQDRCNIAQTISRPSVRIYPRD